MFRRIPAPNIRAPFGSPPRRGPIRTGRSQRRAGRIDREQLVDLSCRRPGGRVGPAASVVGALRACGRSNDRRRGPHPEPSRCLQVDTSPSGCAGQRLGRLGSREFIRPLFELRELTYNQSPCGKDDQMEAVAATAAPADDALAARTRTGDREAFKALYEPHVGGVFDFVLRVVRDRDEATAVVRREIAKAWELFREW